MRDKKTIDEIINLVKQNDVSFIRLQFTDIFGSVKNVAVTVEQLQRALNNLCVFDGSCIEGFVRIEESDMYLWPDIKTFQIFPWRQHGGRVARFICDVYVPNGEPFIGDPRFALKKAIKNVKQMGYDFVSIGTECEFFLFHTDKDGKPTTITHDNAGYFDFGPEDLGEDARREMCMALEEMGFEVEASHHEVSPGQHEIDLKHSDALSMADDLLTFKMVVKTIAQRNGLHATFMPKPIEKINGSGMHTNLMLYKNGKNIFSDENNPSLISNEAKYFIAGVMKYIKEISALTNPIVNSYKRLLPDYEAPVYIAWSSKSRSPLIRVPSERGELTRLEIRNPDLCANPYLAFSAIISAGMEGIKNKLNPPEAVDENIFIMGQEERDERSIYRMPVSLGSAIDEMKNSNFVKAVLGEHIFYKYLEAKEKEWEQYCSNVSEWELNQYIKR